MVLYGDMLYMVLYGDMLCMVLYGDMDQICRGDPAHTDVQSIFSSVMKLQKTISQICYKILAVSLQYYCDNYGDDEDDNMVGCLPYPTSQKL